MLQVENYIASITISTDFLFCISENCYSGRKKLELTFLHAVFLVALLVCVWVVLVRCDTLHALVVMVLVASALGGFRAF
jgi:hypothetical protein